MGFDLKSAFKKTEESKRSAFIMLAVVLFCHHTLFSYFEIIIGKLPVLSIFKSLFFPLLYTYLIFNSYSKKRIRYVKISDLLLILFFALSILSTCIVYPENTTYILEALGSHILPCIPFFLLGLCIDTDDQTMDQLSKYSAISIIVSVLYVFYYLGTGRALGVEDSGYNMYWSYLLLPNILIIIGSVFKKRNKLAIFCSIIGILYVFAMGTRGPLIVLFSYIGLLSFNKFGRNILSKITITILTVGVSIIFIQSEKYYLVLNSFRSTLVDTNLSTRIVDYLINGKMVTYTSGRTDISKDLLDKVWQHPLIGHGIYGEWPLGYHSAHNMYIEVIFHYGIFIGIIMILIYVFIYIKTFFTTKKAIEKDWLILLGCLVFVKGSFGGRYMEYPVFLLLGLCLRILRHARSIS